MGKLSELELPKNAFGLALAGGGIRGYSQIPVFEVLEKNNFVPSFVAGTSIGSFVATLVALEMPSQYIYKAFSDFEKTFVENKTFSHPNLNAIKPTKNKINGLVDGTPIEAILDDFFAKYGVKYMDDIKKPLVLVSVDIISGKTVYFTNMEDFKPSRPDDSVVITNERISVAIRCSCSFPGVINTRDYGDMSMVDGGVKMNLPVEPLRDMGAERIMSLTMSADLSDWQSRSTTRTLKRCYDVMSRELLKLQIKQSDFNINLDVGDIKAFDVGRGEEIYKIAKEIVKGYEQDIVAFCNPPEPEPEPEPVQETGIKAFFKKLFKK